MRFAFPVVPLVALLGYACTGEPPEQTGHASSAALAVGTPFEVDTPVYEAMGDDPLFPSVASSGNGRLVVWSGVAGGSRNIYARRWALDGAFPETLPIIVSELPAAEVEPVVASDGSDFLVVWADEAAKVLRAARIADDGTLLDSPPLDLGTYVASPKHRIVYGAGQYYVTWTSGPGDSVRAARVASSGVVLDAGGLLLDPWITCLGSVTYLASNNQSYLVACGTYSQVDQEEIHGVRISPTNAALDSPPLLLAGGPGYQAARGLGAVGTSYLMSYVASSPSTYATRLIASDGQLSAPTLTQNLVGSTLAFDGQHVWFALPISATDATAKRANASGAPVDGVPITLGYCGWGANRSHAAADLTGEVAFVWEREDNNVFRVFGARAMTNGTVVDAGGLLVPTAPELYANDQHDSVHASNGQLHLVVWEDDRVEGETGIYGARITSSGQVLDPDAIAIAVSGDDREPSVTWNGVDFVVAYTSPDPPGTRVVRAAQVSVDGQVTPIPKVWGHGSFDARTPDIVRGNGRYLLAFGLNSVTTAQPDIHAFLMDDAFAAIGTTVTANGADPKVAFDGTDYMVTWRETNLLAEKPIWVEALTSAGQPLGPITISNDGARPAIASDGSQYVVTWTSPTTNELNATRVTSSGFPIGGPTLIAPNAGYFGSRIVFDGTDFLVAWQQSNGDVLAAQLSQTGQLIDAVPFPIAASAEAEMEPALSFSGSQILATYTVFDTAPTQNAHRIRGVFLSDAGRGGAGGGGEGGAGGGGAGPATSTTGSSTTTGGSGGAPQEASASTSSGGPASVTVGTSSSTSGGGDDDEGSGCSTAHRGSGAWLWLIALVPWLRRGRRNGLTHTFQRFSGPPGPKERP